MKVVILAGGFGTRISEESHLIPKPMIEIGGKPILWHIMKMYSSYGYNEFVICLGYKGYCIKEFFLNYYLYNSDVTINLETNELQILNNTSEPWKITLVDTGLNTMTGGRIKRVKDYIGNDDFMLTYGDGVSDVNIAELVKFHKSHGKLATMTAISNAQRFGILDIDADNGIKSFREKNHDDSSLINGGFMVLSPKVIDLIKDDTTIFEKTPLELLAKDDNLMAYKHNGFWQCMDTLRDKQLLESLWSENKAPWRNW